MSLLTRRRSRRCLATFLVIVAALAGCGKNETGEVQPGPPPSPIQQPSEQPTVRPTATPFVLGQLIEPGIDLWAPPVRVAIELQIPVLKVNAPVWGVGLTAENVMDSPKGPIGDPVWNTAFWFRGGGIPGDIGTATIAGHVNDPLGQAMIFARLERLIPGDMVIVHLKNTNIDVRFKVDQIKVYSVQDSSKPEVLEQIFGIGAVSGTGPQPSPDGLSHLTLITCAGYIVDGEFNKHTVVYTTRSK